MYISVLSVSALGRRDGEGPTAEPNADLEN